MSKPVPAVTFLEDISDKDELSEVVITSKSDHIKILEIASQDEVMHVVSGEKESIEGGHIQSVINFYSQAQELFDNTFPVVFSNECMGDFTENRLSELSVSFHRSDEKSSTIESVKAFLENHKVPSVVLTKVLLAADEMFTNSLYNAPVGPQGEAVCRSKPITLEKGKKNRMSIGLHDNQLALFCEDAFGTLDCKKFIKHILSKYKRQGTDFINPNLEGGAGIGSYLMYEMCKSLYLAVEPGKRTLIGYTYHLDRRKNREDSQEKQIHIPKI